MSHRANPIKVLLVDDHSIVREGLKRILNQTPSIEVVAEAGSGNETLEAFSRMHPDLTLLDISLPDMSGVDVLKELRKRNPSSKVLILTMHPEDQFAIHAKKAGAVGYMTKETAPEKLIEAIGKVFEGEEYFNTLQLSKAMNPHQKLSEREFQVFRMIAQGLQPKQMAQDLSVSVKTINTYRARILEKMEFNSNAQVVQYAVKNKLV